MRPDEATVLQTACPLDCPDACSLEVHLDQGRVQRLEGDHRNPVTAGFICTKVRKFPEHMYGPDRLLRPMLRSGHKGSGEFRPATWEEAFTVICQRLEEIRSVHGGEAILPYFYGGSNGSLSQGTTDARFFRRLGASELARTICAAATGAAAMGLYGKMPGVAYPDFAEARLIVLWGANPSGSGIHLVPWIEEAKRRGARLVVVDPRRIPLARGADLHLALKPGTDLSLALALHRWLFEHDRADLAFLARHASGVQELRARAAHWSLERAAEVTGVPAHDIAALARLYADSSPALVRCGWGLERNRNGGSAVAAVLALPAVAGKFGVRGGGYTLSNSSYWKLDAERAVGEPPGTRRVLNMNQLGRQLNDRSLSPPIGALFVYNANPLATTPEQALVEQGLCREDLFTVVFDAVATDTSRYADVLLPATTFLEHEDLSRGYGATVLQRSRPVVAPVGESRSNFEVFLELCDRMGLSRAEDERDPEAFVSAALEANGHADRHTAALAAGGISPAPIDRPVQMVDVLPRTEDGKVHLFPNELDREALYGLYAYQDDPATERFPLALISPASSKTVSSTFGQLAKKPATLAIDAADARARGIVDGELVRVWNELGEVHVTAKVSREMRPGVVELPKGLWRRSTANGYTSNALSPATLTDLGAGACFNDARVEVAPLGRPTQHRIQ